MNRKRLFNWGLTGCCLFFLHMGMGQELYSYEVPLDTVGRVGVYKILLTPDVAAKCKPGLADVRIVDASGQFTGYVMHSDAPVTAGQGFIELPLLSDGPGNDSIHAIQFSHLSAGRIDRLLMYVHNFNARRSYTLSGSNDREHWFVIQEHMVWKPGGTDSTGYILLSVDFPASDYRYFSISQEEKGVLPINIARIVVPTEHLAQGSYRPTPAPQLSQKDSTDHHSYITLTFAEPYLLDRLELDVVGPRLYKRRMHIRSNDDPEDIVVDIDPQHRVFQLPAFKTRQLILSIDNEDNTPLVINNATTSQLERYLLAVLQPGVQYKLLAGNPAAAAPTYDLRYFTDSLRGDAALIVPGSLQAVVRPASAAVPRHRLSGALLWAVIGAALSLLIILCYSMMKAIEKQKEENL